LKWAKGWNTDQVPEYGERYLSIASWARTDGKKKSVAM